ncbi:MAG: SDR family oxidoreductase [Acidobacteriota bacterium]|nr:SDR family oxidoreductase [Acidobacteriota bacterium]
MILVTGATGKSGSEIVKQLSEAGAPVRALVRNSQKAAGLSALAGVEIVEGDLDKPDSLDAALRGVERALLLSAAEPRSVELQGNFIEAARRAGLKHVVKFSGIGADENLPGGFLKWHGQIERQLRESGIPHTNLRPNVFMQELLNSWGGQRTIYLPMGDAKLSLVDIRDIAAVAVKTLTENGHAGQSYVITGPEALTLDEIAAKISTAIGEPVNYVSISFDDFRQSLAGMQLPEWLASALVELYRTLATDGAQVTDVVAKVGKKQPINFDEFAREHGAKFKGE